MKNKAGKNVTDGSHVTAVENHLGSGSLTYTNDE